MHQPDCLIVGAGVIGLSLAWELAQQGQRVRLVDQSEPGREASWAGAGILPPANRRSALHPYDQLRALSIELHPEWAEKLRNLTGIDTGYRRCGAIYLARTPGETAALIGWAGAAADEQLTVERLSRQQLNQREPALADSAVGFRVIYHLPEEAQLRNPRHLKALKKVCEMAGVEIQAHTTVTDATIEKGRILALETSAGRLSAGSYCFTAGSWTGRLLGRLGFAVSVLPMRGQMVLFHGEKPPIRAVINEGPRYIVPRDDGRVLVGSTEEEVGFDKRTTEESLAELRNLACELIPSLCNAEIEHSWAGFRPATFDGFPYLGPLPDLKNAFVAAGHFRSGIYLSPGTAVAMRELICGRQPEIDLGPFRVGR